MINIPINEAETIFEPFYDGGDSYPDHEKFSPLTNYKVTCAAGTVATVEQGWCAATVTIQSQKAAGYSVKMERDCQLDISGYDIFRLFAAVPKSIQFRICAVIDGQDREVMVKEGTGETGEFDGNIAGNLLTHISLEFWLKKPEMSLVELRWMGLSNAEKQAAMEAKKSPYNARWEGCFVENPEIKPMIGLFFSEDELEGLRERLNREPFLSMTNKLREKAEEAMQIEPEGYIFDYVPRRDGRWGRERDMKRPMFQENMDVLAFIGLLDNRTDMLHMACRKMLSIAVTPYWTESIMGHLPGATWHHRSFTEDDLCSATALVLDFAGSLLTWHGKNVVYDALIMKGLPRFQADFYTMEYIRGMNQGIVFNHGRVLALLALAHRYPRYEAILQEAARDNREMIDSYIMEDGGTCEGPSYWNYTFMNTLVTVALLARHEKKTLAEYAWDKLKLTGDFALTMLSDGKDGTCVLPVNDSHSNRYSSLVCSVYKEISDDLRWEILYNRAMLDSTDRDVDLATVLLSSDISDTEVDICKEGFQTLNQIGHTSLRRMTEDVGMVHCYLSGGPGFFAHCHGDKGQIILEVNKVPMLIDRGICAYSNPAVFILQRSELHNVFMPEAPEGVAAYTQDITAAGAKIVRSGFENGVFDYCTDVTGAWDEAIVKSMTRSVKSEDAHTYMIYDDAEFAQELGASFRLNTYGTIAQQDNSWIISDGGYEITVTPVNYTPESAEYGENGTDGELQPVNSLALFVAKAKEHHIVTRLEVSTVK